MYTWPIKRNQSSAVLGVKPAIEDVDAQIFLAFHCASVEDQIESSNIYVGENRAKASRRLAYKR
jgi:hypothetical protein